MQEESSSECMAIFLLDPEDLDPRLRIAYILEIDPCIFDDSQLAVTSIYISVDTK
jgi:hypothetical protein